MTSLNIISENKCFNGMQYIYSHTSSMTHCTMRFGLFLPPQAKTTSLPVLYWLSGLTCTEENFIIKAGAQRIASELGIILVTPDTSPRGLNLPEENANYDFGLGAGFYVDATNSPWSTGYKMYSYITQELPALITANFPIDPQRVGIFGHSMGGHGALMIALRNPNYYKSVSAFSPISSLIQSPWGENALQKYIGSDQQAWKNYDVISLIEKYGWKGPSILIDQGTQDKFISSQLKPELLREACIKANIKLDLRMQEGYDHSYFFISSFIEDHLQFHAKNL